jgi:predicted site-specific integrase-resolvase
MADSKDLISLDEAGKIAGVSRISIWRWVRDGRLKGHRIADRVFVSRRELERFSARRKARR